jgi:hypothetical protein
MAVKRIPFDTVSWIRSIEDDAEREAAWEEHGTELTAVDIARWAAELRRWLPEPPLVIPDPWPTEGGQATARRRPERRGCVRLPRPRRSA